MLPIMGWVFDLATEKLPNGGPCGSRVTSDGMN